MLSFVEDFCEISEKSYSLRDDLFLHYKEYCGNAGMKPVSQTNFNKEIEGNYISVKRSRDKISRRHIWSGIAYCEGGKDA